MLPLQTLTRQSENNCLSHAQNRVMGALKVTVNGNTVLWDEIQQLHIFSQSMTIWRHYGRIDVILNSAGSLVGFIDHEKYLEPGHVPLDKAEAEELIRAAGVIPDSAKLEKYFSLKPPKGEGLIWKAVFALERPEKDYALLDVEVNAATKTVISVRPKRREPGHA